MNEFCVQFMAGGQYDFIGFVVVGAVVGWALWRFVESFR